jgi:hypothetical protein
MFVIYEMPTDHPDKFVVREWQIVYGDPQPGCFWLLDSLTAARAKAVEQGALSCIRRDASDDSKIVETWL